MGNFGSWGNFGKIRDFEKVIYYKKCWMYEKYINISEICMVSRGIRVRLVVNYPLLYYEIKIQAPCYLSQISDWVQILGVPNMFLEGAGF